MSYTDKMKAGIEATLKLEGWDDLVWKGDKVYGYLVGDKHVLRNHRRQITLTLDEEEDNVLDDPEPDLLPE